MTLLEFWQKCRCHDWYNAFSDDGAVWRAGEANYKRLAAAAKEGGPEFEAMLKQFGEHFFSGEPWGTEKVPMPKEPGKEKGDVELRNL